MFLKSIKQDGKSLKRWCFIHKAHLVFWHKFWNFSLMKYSQILGSNLIVFAFECQAWITMADIIPEYWSKFFSECVIFALKFWKNLGFSLSEHCELGTRCLDGNQTWVLFSGSQVCSSQNCATSVHQTNSTGVDFLYIEVVERHCAQLFD